MLRFATKQPKIWDKGTLGQHQAILPFTLSHKGLDRCSFFSKDSSSGAKVIHQWLESSLLNCKSLGSKITYDKSFPLLLCPSFAPIWKIHLYNLVSTPELLSTSWGNHIYMFIRIILCVSLEIFTGALSLMDTDLIFHLFPPTFRAIASLLL